MFSSHRQKQNLFDGLTFLQEIRVKNLLQKFLIMNQTTVFSLTTSERTDLL